MNCYICKSPAIQLVSYHFGSACEDCGELIETAINAIQTARQVGVPKYGPSHWRSTTISDHIEHGLGHIEQLLAPDPRVTEIHGEEDHLAHAICRLVMARANEKGLETI